MLNLVILRNMRGTYVGNNSDVVAIVNHLPGGETFQSVSLENESIKVNYGAKGNGPLTEDMVETYWFDGKDTMEKNFLFNVIYLAILVPNAKSYEFQVENKNFTIKEKKYYQSCMKNLIISQKKMIYGIKRK